MPAVPLLWVVCWIFFFFVWILLVEKTEVSELITGAVAAAFGATLTTALHARHGIPFKPGVRWTLKLWRLVPQAVFDLGVLVAVLWRRLVLRQPVSGSFRAVPFHVSGGDAEANARRVLATGAGSFAPNTYVVDVDEERGLILVHQLERRESLDPLELG